MARTTIIKLNNTHTQTTTTTHTHTHTHTHTTATTHTHAHNKQQTQRNITDSVCFRLQAAKRGKAVVVKMANYDEDLYDNPFFLTIHKQFVTLFNNAVAEKALVRLNNFAYRYIYIYGFFFSAGPNW